MNKPERFYESHLVMGDRPLSPGAEWRPALPGWSLLQNAGGAGYWLQAQSSTELEPGSVLLLAENVEGRVRASRLNGVSISYFNVMPDRLTGLITLGELEALKLAAARKEPAPQFFPPGHPVAAKMKELSATRNQTGLLFRLTLLQLLAGALNGELDQSAPRRDHDDARKRLQEFLKTTPPDALLKISLQQLAQITQCTPRHLSRIFYDLTGMSFRDKRAEIRLARARELLATSKSKVVEVALESGYNSLSLFNLMFTRRFGLSPGKWRQKNLTNGSRTKNRRNGLTRQLLNSRK